MRKREAVEAFRRECRAAFGFLVNEHGFSERELPRGSSVNAIQVQYQNVSTFVSIEGVSWGQGIDVRIGRLEPEPWEIYRSYALEWLIGIRCPERSLIGADGFRLRSSQTHQLRHYAEALQECGRDVLAGDFSILPELHKAIEQKAGHKSGA